MTAAVLTRAPFRPLEVTESWDKTLLEQAVKLIGYRPKALTLAEQTRTRSVNEAIFARALEAVGIEPFTLQSVEGYKAAMVQEVQKGQSWCATRYMHQSGRNRMEKGQTVVHAVGWPSWIGLLGTTAVGLLNHFVGYNAGWGWDGYRSIQIINHTSLENVALYSAISGIGVATWTFLMFLRYKRAHQVLAAWHIVPVQNSHEVIDANGYRVTRPAYDEAIPAFAVQRMLSLKQELPEVTFSVEQLQAERVDLNTEHRVKLPPDPFLIATFRGISAYVDVWDEPKFEGRRTV